MKKNFNILIALTFVLFSTTTFAEDEIIFFNSAQATDDGTGGTGGSTGGGTGEEDPDPQAPINDYLPLLLAGGLAIVAFNRKKIFTLK